MNAHDQAPEQPRIILSGGGTGGHIFPALAVADQIREWRPQARLLFVGALGRMEMERIPKAGYPIEGLWISGFQRRFTPGNLLFPLKLGASLWKARRIIRRFGPHAVAGFGGFASGPTLEMAARMGVPTLIQEQNSFPGITNRLLGRRVDRICVAYPGMDRFFPAGKMVQTGNPVRKDLLGEAMPASTGRRRLGLHPEKPTLLVLGGSLGARRLNDAMEAAGALWRDRPDLQVLWQVGKLYEREVLKTEAAGLPNVHARAFIEDMPAAYAAADVVLCRAGALTLSELAVLGKAAVLVPSPNVAEDHQTQNALALVNRGAARMVPDRQAGERVIPLVLSLLDAPAEQKALAASIAQLAKPEATEQIARAVLDLASNGKT